MANIETHLRELGVLVGIKNEVSDLKLTSASISDSDFCSIIDSILTSSKHSQYNNIRSVKFGLSERNIIKNAFELSKVIVNKLHIHSIISADWFGYDSGKEEPYDIEVNGLYISLKENSFILENMGLYKLLNCFTGSTYKTRHIFEDYAPKEYSSWFDTTWKCLLTYLSNHSNEWNYINPKNHNKRAKITKTSTAVILEYIEEKFNVSITLPINCTLNDFKIGTTSQIREGVFSKFIKDKLDSNPAYNSKKRTCAIAASNALENELNKNLNYSSGLARFLRIHSNEYFYAKKSSNGVELYKVPAEKDFTSTIQITSIVGSVPDKQANILTTIKNTRTGNTLVLRNECRFSHGQFNGTPEAKLYYEHGGSLDIIYTKL